ncbi:MAG: nucleotidyltransferase [Lachnospira sp.]
MKSVGIVCEYNPLHNGHIFHINESKRITGADVVICAMSGNYVQRGEPAIIDKYTRCRNAVDYGADIVVELPVHTALSSAENFAAGAILTLSALKAESICFGSESGDISNLLSIAKVTLNETNETSEYIKNLLAGGMSYPSALSVALKHFYNIDETITSNPNNTLGIEYLKAIIKYNTDIKPYTIKRIGAGYNSNSFDTFMSASGIRNIINSKNNDELNNLKNYIPIELFNQLNNDINNIYPVSINDFSVLFNYKMSEIINLSTTKGDAIEKLCSYPDISKDFANRMLCCYEGTCSITEYIESVKTKNITYARISRSIMRIILGITKTAPDINFVRILGLSDVGRNYLKAIKNDVTVPLITKVADNKELLSEEIHYNNIYNQIVKEKYNTKLKDEFRAGIYLK